jgi:hypothetical protein
MGLTLGLTKGFCEKISRAIICLTTLDAATETFGTRPGVTTGLPRASLSKNGSIFSIPQPSPTKQTVFLGPQGFQKTKISAGTQTKAAL